MQKAPKQLYYEDTLYCYKDTDFSNTEIIVHCYTDEDGDKCDVFGSLIYQIGDKSNRLDGLKIKYRKRMYAVDKRSHVDIKETLRPRGVKFCGLNKKRKKQPKQQQIITQTY